MARKGFRSRQAASGGRITYLVAPSPAAAPRPPSRARQFYSRAVSGTRRAVGLARSGGFRGARQQATYAAVTRDWGVQIGMEVGEATAALAKGAMDAWAATTQTTADDLAFPWLQKGVAFVLRAGAGRYVAGKNPGLAAVMSAFGSSLSGCVYYRTFQALGVRAQERVQGPRNP